jgi:hypothetical protein
MCPQRNDAAAIESGGLPACTGALGATISRKSSLFRDILFPIYSVEQLLWVLLFCVLTYFISIYFGDWHLVLFGYVGGSLSLTTMAPAKLRFRASALPLFYDLLKEMHFTKDPNSTRFRYHLRWLVFRNSSLELRCNDETAEVDGPMSTLRFIAAILNRRYGKHRAVK